MSNDLSALKSLLDEGADPNTFDDIGFTPLHYAAKNEQLEMVRLLLKTGADVNANDETQIGNNAIGEVAGNCSLEMAKLLLDAGADPTFRGWMQLSALDRAQDRKRGEGRRVYDLLMKAAVRFQKG